MSLIAKLAGGTVALAVASAGGYFLNTAFNTYGQPLANDDPAPIREAEYGTQYKDYLTGTDEANDKGGEKTYKVFRKVRKDSIKTKKFSELRKPTSGESEAPKTFKDLRRLCGEIYKVDKGKVKEDVDSTQDEEFKESEVGKFCSPVKSIVEAKERYAEGSYGEKYQDHLAAIKDNYIFGRQRFAALAKETANNKIEETETSLLKKINFKVETVDFLRKNCEIAYQIKESEDDELKTQYPEEDIFKYCTVLGKSPKAVSSPAPSQAAAVPPAGAGVGVGAGAGG